MSNPANVITDRDIGISIDIARSTMRPEDPLDYHNFDYHVQGVINYAHRDHADLSEKGVKDINLNTLIFLLLYHDSWYHLNHRAHGYEYKEDISREEAGIQARKLGKSKQIVELVDGGVDATRAGVIPATNLQKASRAADMGNVNDTFPEFAGGFFRVTKEQAKSIKLDLGIPAVKNTFRKQVESASPFLYSLVSPPPEFINEEGEVVTLSRHNGFVSNIQRINRLSLSGVVKAAPVVTSLIPEVWKTS